MREDIIKLSQEERNVNIQIIVALTYAMIMIGVKVTSPFLCIFAALNKVRGLDFK